MATAKDVMYEAGRQGAQVRNLESWQNFQDALIFNQEKHAQKEMFGDMAKIGLQYGSKALPGGPLVSTAVNWAGSSIIDNLVGTPKVPELKGFSASPYGHTGASIMERERKKLMSDISLEKELSKSDWNLMALMSGGIEGKKQVKDLPEDVNMQNLLNWLIMGNTTSGNSSPKGDTSIGLSNYYNPPPIG